MCCRDILTIPHAINMVVAHVNQMFTKVGFVSLLVLFLLIISLLFSKSAVAQTVIWSETFPEGNGVTSDPEGRWTVNPSNTNFSIQNNELRARGSINGLWTSESINISAYAYISLSADIREAGDMESTDYIRLEYNLDGNGWNTFETNGYIESDFGSATAAQNNLSGNSLALRIRMVNSANNEYYYADNIVVTGSDTPDYCASNGTMQYDDGITLVNFNTINNITAKTSGYSDYTAISTDVFIDAIYDLTVNLDTDGDYVNYSNAWIDWNQDGDFNDAGEEYDLGSVSNNPDGATSNSPLAITVPSSATAGPTRMRVSTKYAQSPIACEINFDGETEDYAINILPACSVPDTPTLSATSPTICSGESTTLSVASGNLNDADHWQWYSGSCGGTAVGQGTSITVSPATTTTYYARGEGNCDGTTCGSVTVTVNPGMPDYDANITDASCPSDLDGSIETTLAVPIQFNNPDYIDIGSTLLSNQSQFTLEGWIKVDLAAVGSRISLFGQNDVIELGFSSSTVLNCWTSSGGSVSATGIYPSDNGWHHVAAVGNGTSIILYIDGIPVATGGSSTANYGTDTGFSSKIGAGVWDPTEGYFPGSILKVGFWNVALDATEISNLASEYHNYTNSEAGLLAGYNFYEGSGTTLGSEISGTDGAFNGTPTWNDPYSYSWTKTGDGSFSSDLKNLTGITSGEYNLTVVFGSCTRTKSFTVNSNFDVPAISLLSSPSVLCVGDSFNPPAPSVSDNGSVIISQGWEIETSVGSRIFVSLPVPHTTVLSDNGKEIRYFATNSCGISYSNTLVIVGGEVLYIPGNDTTICAGETATLKVKLEDKAVLLNGTNGRIDIPNSDQINITNIVQNRTVALWFNANNVSTRQVLYEEGAGVNGFSIFLENGYINVHAWESNNTWGQVRTIVSSATWYHIAFVFDSGATDGEYFKGYLNGSYFGGNSNSNGSDGMNVHSGDVSIGMSDGIRFPDNNTYSNNYYNGYIDEFKLWNRSLDGSELLSERWNVNDGTHSGSNLIVYYDFNNDTSPTVTDLTGGNNGSLYNGVIYSTETPFTPTISWLPGGMTGFSEDVSPASTTDYTYTLTQPFNSCQTNGTITVTVESPAEPGLSATVSSICPGDDAVFTISGTPGDTVTYNGASTGTAIIETGGSVNITVPGATGNTTLNLTSVKSGSCSLPLSGISETITAEETQSPVANCFSDITVYLDENGEAIITPAMIDNGSTDNCGIDTMWVSPETLSCSGTGSTETVYSKEIVSTDGYTVNIEISDLTLALLTSCPATWYNYEVQYNYSISFSGTNIPSSGLWSLDLNFDCIQDLSGNLPNSGGIGSDQTYSATRNESDCASVTFNDLNCNLLSVNINGPGIADQTVTLDKITGSSTQNVTLTVMDYNGNTSTCQTTVTLNDEIVPVPDVTSLPDITAECEVTSLTAPTATDNCAGTITGTTTTTLPITTQGTTVVTWTYDDGNGNLSTQTQNIIIDDVTDPTITCPADVTESVDPGLCIATGIDLGSPVTGDNCGVASVTNDAPGTFPLGTTTVTWTVTDNSGNTDTCTQNITIVPEEDIDIEVVNLAGFCQNGQTGTTTIAWTVQLNTGTTGWTYDFTINDGSTDVDSGTGVSASRDITISYDMANGLSDQTYTLTISNVKDNCGVSETGTSNNSDAVTVYAVPATGEIIPD